MTKLRVTELRVTHQLSAPHRSVCINLSIAARQRKKARGPCDSRPAEWAGALARVAQSASPVRKHVDEIISYIKSDVVVVVVIISAVGLDMK